MADIKTAFGTVTTFTTTALQSLAAAAAWQSAAVDNSANLYLDALVQLTIVLTTGTSGADKGLTVFAYGSIDGGTTYPEAVSGSEGTLSLATDRNLRQIGFVPATVQSTTYKSEPMSVAAAFGGVLPGRWGIVIYNNSAIALTTGNVAKWIGVYGTSI